MTLSDRILAENAEVLSRMLGHRFVRDIASGTLPAEVFHRYLAYEGAFVRTAIGIFAYATARAPDLEAQRWLIGVQQALAGEQVGYFEETFAALDIAPPQALPPEAAAFGKAMGALAETGDFLDIVTAMFAAEWMYWSWCREAARADIADPHARRWVALHADEAFAAQARWLKDAIDRYGAEADAARLSDIFALVTELEIRFHHAPYADEEAKRHA